MIRKRSKLVPLATGEAWKIRGRCFATSKDLIEATVAHVIH